MREHGLGRTRHRPLFHCMTAPSQWDGFSVDAAMMDAWDRFIAPFVLVWVWSV